MQPRKMLCAFAAVLFLAMAHAGDEFLMPTMRAGSAFESADPKYRVVGIDDSAGEHRLFVVADSVEELARPRALGNTER
jgi:hypothetical protein